MDCKTDKHAKTSSSKMRLVLGWYVPDGTSHPGASIKITSTVELEED